MKTLERLIQPAQLKSSFSEKIILVKGIPGKVIVPSFVALKTSAGTAYGSSNALLLKHDGVIGDLLSTNLLHNTEAFKSQALSYGDNLNDLVGKDLVLETSTADPTGGNLSLDIFLTYTEF